MAKHCKVVDVSSMPANVLDDFLNCRLSFEDAYRLYPGDKLVTEKSAEQTPKKDSE